MSETKLPAMKVTSGSYPVFVGSAPLSTLHSISFVDAFTMDTEEGIQRPLDKPHAKKFRDYMATAEQGEKVTAPPLIFSLREPTKTNNGHLLVPTKKQAMARLDCQHRLEYTGDLNVSLPFVIYTGLTREEEIRIFTDINDKHKGLTKSLVDSHRFSLSKDPKEEAPHLAISVQLNKDSDSPWSQAVNTGGISQSSPGGKRKITLRTFQEANRVLISGPRGQNADYEVKYEATKNYWQAVATIFADAWTNSRKHLLTKGVGIAALAELGKYVIEDCLGNDDTSVAAMADHLKKLEGFDWGNQTSPLKLVGGQKGAKGAAKAFMAIVFGKKELSDMGELLEA
ncbi:MAG: DGQHR domain-containing protein [Terriglobales bacterium]